MQTLNLPSYEFNIKNSDGRLLIFDALRRKFLVLTPEEWVRQNIIRYLIEEKKYPPGLISTEAGIKINTLQRRYDGLIYSKDKKPLVLLECKSPKIKINQSVFDQIFAYNTQIIAPYLLVTNGLQHFFLKKDESGKIKFEQHIPLFTEIE
jgi:hypothetical protein